MKNIEILKAKIKEIEDDKVEKWWLKIIPKTTTYKAILCFKFFEIFKSEIIDF